MIERYVFGLANLLSDNYYARVYGDPDWGKMKLPDYPQLVRDAIAAHPDVTEMRLVDIIMREQGGKVNPTSLIDEIRRQKSS